MPHSASLSSSLLWVAAGFTTAVELTAGKPAQVLPALVRSQGAALLVMGAYGHSRIRQLIVGSTTTTLLRQRDVPVSARAFVGNY